MNEGWKSIPGYEFYEVSNFGQVRHIGGSRFHPNMRLRKLKTTKLGYVQIILKKGKIPTTFYVHRLVGVLFVENPDNKPEINHKDGNKANNRADNLEWVTKAENKQHANRTGLWKLSEEHRLKMAEGLRKRNQRLKQIL